VRFFGRLHPFSQGAAPIIAAAMDGVVSPSFAIEMGRVGGLAVLNLGGILFR